MGCDIHMHIEYLDGDGWEHFCSPSIGRWYGLFALMAGVRNYDNITPVAEPRGLPADMDSWTRYKYKEFESDAHTPSWLTTTEMQEVHHRALISFPEGIVSLYALIKTLEAFEEKGCKARLVFWFDN